jgi:O-methyltransferase involved in polyketide biosynthesis
MLRRLAWEPAAYDRDWIVQTGIAIRTAILDEQTRRFVASRAGAVVVNLGAGLCTRLFRVDDGNVRWIDVDLPEVIALRAQLVPAHDRSRAIARSVLDDTWTAAIGDIEGRPVLFIAEGLLQYFDVRDVARLLQRMAERFPGAHMLIEAVSPLARVCSRRQPALVAAGVRIRWSLRRAADLEAWSPHIRVVAQHYYDHPRRRWRWLRALGWIGAVRKLMTIVDVEFEAAGGSAGREVGAKRT